MADGKGDTTKNLVLDWLLTSGTATRPSARKLALTSTGTTSSAVGTELTGTGYTAGGVSLTFGSASSGSSVTSGSPAATLTNGSNGTWTVTGFTLHKASSGAPAAGDMLYFGNGLSISVPDGADLEITSLTITEA